MILFYSPDLNETHTKFSFNKEESHHITRVLRKKNGDNLCLTNGRGWQFDAEITAVFSKSCEVKILKHKFTEPVKHNLHIAIAPTKMNDRFEWFLEKATEIGIQSITPLICERSERKVIKLERMEKVIQSGMKQSFQFYLPKLEAPKSFTEFINSDHATQKFIAHCEDINKQQLFKAIKPKSDYTILIGPEGDFTTQEIELALASNYTPVSLGQTRLRTETAGVVACHTINLINDDF